MPTNSDFEAKLRTFTAKRQEKSGESVNTISKKTRTPHTRSWPRRGRGEPPRFRHSRVGGKPEIQAVKKRQIKGGPFLDLSSFALLAERMILKS